MSWLSIRGGWLPEAGPMIEAVELGKTYGSVRALHSVSLTVHRGSVLGVLGHNGAGKTTLVNILTANVPPSSGRARVANLDVRKFPREVRRRIGLVNQVAAVDGEMSGRANLVLIARLLGYGGRDARTKADQLLETFDLTGAANRRARTYSGGMRRRLDLAAGLVGHPDVIFLDEPTTGLDPSSRLGMWEIIEGLVADGTTVLLTTQYLEEADRLADSIAVMSMGTVVACGTAADLKARIGRRTVAVAIRDARDCELACVALSRAGLAPLVDDIASKVTAPIADSADVTLVVHALDSVGVAAAGFSFREPSLDDVYLAFAVDNPGAA